jgi:hypothetical protein
MCGWLLGRWQGLDRDEAMACLHTLEHTTSSVTPRSVKDDKT